MQLNTYADISAFVNTIFDDALFAARESGLMINLVSGFSGQGMAARKSQEYNKGTAKSVVESDDLTSDAFTPAALGTLTPAEVGLQFFLSDQRVESDPFAVRNDAAIELGGAISDKVETDLLGNFSSLTGGTIGASGTTITWGHIFAAKAVLKAQKAPGPYFCVLHDYQWEVLAKAASIATATTPVAAPGLTEEISRNFFVQRVADLSIFTSSNIALSGTDAYGAVFSRPAMALDIRRAPRLEPERDASRRGWELNMSAVYAHGVWRPKFGVQLLFACATPTS
jgi:hypothetical protein